MKSELFRIGPFVGHSYGLMIGLGVIAAYMMGEYRARKKGLDADIIFPLAIWCVVGGILGAKVLYYITILPEIIRNPALLLDVSNGFVVYGGIIFGIFSGFLFTKKHHIDFWRYFDLVMPSIALAQGFGRIGCFLAGCCYGKETESWFHVVFHDSPLAPNGVALIPTQLISAALNFLHFGILVWFARRNRPAGQVAGLYLVCYSIGRFFLEYLRGDMERGNVGVFSTSQFISLFLVVVGIGIFTGAGILAKRKD